MPPPNNNGAISRSALIERLMKENVLDENSSELVPLELEGFLPRRRSWNDFSMFLQDNLAEVEQKLSQIETQIWGKLIVMERNFRTAKAYLRNSTIIIDGGADEFDGIRIGLSQFHNERRDPRTEMELKFFGKGIKIQLDSSGNLWMKRNSDRRISVKTRQRRDPIILGDEYRKIFDLRIFKESIIASLNVSNGLKGLKNSSNNNKRLKESAIIFLRFGDIPSSSSSNPPNNTKPDYLEAPLWCCLIHLIAMDMIGVIISEFHNNDAITAAGAAASPQNSLQSFESHSCSTSTEESSAASSSSYLPSNNNNGNGNVINNNRQQNNNKTGVARRIFQQRKPNHYQSPFAFEEAFNKAPTKTPKVLYFFLQQLQ
uniref:MH2 domain-containing protein n=1 Tax=Panagrolaimus sp. ES5 TaxID=591445 RepID=A0AC34FJP3_9BILA